MRGSTEREKHGVQLEIKNETQQVEVTVLASGLSIVRPAELGQVEEPGIW
jgi:capsular polysaccharide biosynthesis protein